MARQSTTTSRLKYKIKLLKEGNYHPALEPLSFEKIAKFFKRIHRKDIHKHTVRRYYLEYKDKEVPDNFLKLYAKSHDMRIINELSHLDNVFELLMSTSLRNNIDVIVEQAQKNPLELLAKNFNQKADVNTSFDENNEAQKVNKEANNEANLAKTDEKSARPTPPIQAPFARAKQTPKTDEKITTFDPNKYL